MLNKPSSTSRLSEETSNNCGLSLPLVSVCIGTFNRQDTIRECLDSVVSQTYGNYEIVVADNASTDMTLELVKQYQKVRIVERSENSGMCSTTRNMAARHAKGDYLAFLDSDDAWCPRKLELQVEFMKNNPDIPLCHTYCYIMDEQSAITGVRHEGRLPETGDYFDALLTHCWITISSVLMKRSLYEEIGTFNETLPYGRTGEDYEYFLRVAKQYPVGLVNEKLVKYRKSSLGITSSDWRSTPHSLLFYRELIHRQDLWAGRIRRGDLRDRISRYCVDNSIFWRDRGFPWRAIWAANQGVLMNPVSAGPWMSVMKSLYRLAFPLR